MKTPEEQAAATNTPSNETTNGVPQTPAASEKTAPPFSKKEFDAKNKRRHELIDKEFDGGGLTKEETMELERLQKETGNYIDAVFPLPFHMLDELREIARREGLLDKKSDG